MAPTNLTLGFGYFKSISRRALIQIPSLRRKKAKPEPEFTSIGDVLSCAPLPRTSRRKKAQTIGACVGPFDG
jgi:hypothetical protein